MNAYDLADKTILTLRRKAARRLNEAKKSVIDGLDELNVIGAVYGLYADIFAENRKAYTELFAVLYRQTMNELDGADISNDEIYALAELYVLKLLSEPNGVVGYEYSAEADRKRDRAIEAVKASHTKAQKQLQLERAIRAMNAQAAYFADITAFDATVEAMKNAGVQKVRWVAEGDEKVCLACEKLNGRIFTIDKIPPQQHPHCRCYLVAVK
jgi:SPP1 gp7 family putative phage head morphogenesis protein